MSYEPDDYRGRDQIAGPWITSIHTALWCEPAPFGDPQYDPKFAEENWTEFTITTDPTEAPADALLEGAGYYVEPADEVHERRDRLGDRYGIAHYKTGKHAALHCHDPDELTGWDPYSWDVKRDRGVVEAVIAAYCGDEEADRFRYEVDFTRQAEVIEGLTWTVANVAPTQPCARCNGSGQVAGALGVGLTWTCGECEGKGVV